MVLLGEVTMMDVEDDQNSPQLSALRGLVGEGCRVSEIPCHSVYFYTCNARRGMKENEGLSLYAAAGAVSNIKWHGFPGN
jgi:opacity protein-like surface antigen